jgi:hypothetical protein
MEQVSVQDLHQWGKLIKTWATGVSRFENEVPSFTADQLPIPRSLDELKAQAAIVGARLTIPDHIVGLAIVQYSADTLVVRLPPKERLEAMEATLEQGGDTGYNFPSFYSTFMGRPLNVKERLHVHACRIGDYTISMCA